MSEPNSHKGPDNVKTNDTISMYGEAFYGRHTAKRQHCDLLII